MGKIKDRVLEGIIKQVATNNNMSYVEVEKLYIEYFRVIRSILASQEVKGKTEDEVNDIKDVINIPGFGKFHMNKRKVIAINNKRKEYEE
jgi:nucleoid DNA-binding protein